MQKLTLSLLCAGLLTTTAIAEDICNGAFQSQNYEQAATCYMKQLKKERSLHNLQGVGISLCEQGRYAEALTYFKEAEKSTQTPSDNIIVHSYLGTIYEAIGDSSQGYAYKMKVLNMALKSENIINIANAYNNLGLYFQNQKQLQKALEYYEKSLDYQSEAERSTTYANMSFIYNSLQNYEKAEKTLLKSIDIDEKNGMINKLSTHKFDLASLYFYNNRQDLAQQTASESLMIARHAHSIDIEAHSLALLSILDYRAGRIKDAKSKASESIRLAQKIKDTAILKDAQSAWNLVNGK